MTVHTLKIKANALGMGEIWVDDLNLSPYVQGVAIGMSSGKPTEVHLILPPMHVEIEATVKAGLLTIERELTETEAAAAQWEQFTADEKFLCRFIPKDQPKGEPAKCVHRIPLSDPCTTCAETFPNEPDSN